MKKLLVPLAILLICAFIITGCGTSSSPSPTPSASAPVATTPIATKPASTTPAVTTPTASATVKPLTSPTTGATTPASTAASKYGGLIRYIQSAGPGTPLSAWEATGGVISKLHYVLEPPLREDFGGKLVGRVAETWDVNAKADPPNIVFHLRKGLKFSDGSPCDAKAVAWAFQKS